MKKDDSRSFHTGIYYTGGSEQEKEAKRLTLEHLRQVSIGLDDTFQFQCDQCGKCCINREDIVLNAMDVYRLSKELGLEPPAMIDAYGEIFIDTNTGLPTVRLRPRGSIKRCLFLESHRCSVHKAKPAVCALFPLGRYVLFLEGKDGEPDLNKGEIRYIFNPPHCGSEGETYTVREWLGNFGILPDDPFFLSWSKTVAQLSVELHRIVRNVPEEMMQAVWYAVYTLLYLDYNTEEEFLPQFEENTAKLVELLRNEL